MPNQIVRQLIIENFQDSLRLVRHLMNFGVEDFAEAIGVTRQTVNNLEAKKSKLSATQYIAIAALTDSYFSNHTELLPKLKAVIDSDGKNYGEEYETSFRGDSLLERWFEDFIDFDDTAEDFPVDIEEDDEFDEEDFPDEELWDLAREYKIFLDAETLFAEDAEEFVANLTTALEAANDKIILPLRSVEQIQDAASQDPILQEKVQQAIALIQRMQTNGVLQIFGEETDPDFHDTIIKVFERFRSKYPLCLVTPNENLARAVLSLNDSAEENDFEIEAIFVDEGLINFYDADENLAENFDEPAETNSYNTDKNVTDDFDEPAETNSSDMPEENPSEKKLNGWEEL